MNAGSTEADAGLIVETSDTDDARLFYDVSENLVGRREPNIFTLLITVRLTDDGDGNKGTKPLTTDSSTGDLKVTTLTLAAVGSAITTSNTGLTTVRLLDRWQHLETYGAALQNLSKQVTQVEVMEPMVTSGSSMRHNHAYNN